MVVMDKNLEATRELGDLGVKIVQSPREVAAQVEVVITMLPDSPQVKDVVLGEKGICNLFNLKGILVY